MKVIVILTDDEGRTLSASEVEIDPNAVQNLVGDTDVAAREVTIVGGHLVIRVPATPGVLRALERAQRGESQFVRLPPTIEP